MKCQDCGKAEATRNIYMDGDSFGNDYLHLCDNCTKIHFHLVKQAEDFYITFEECEINGYREYVVRESTGKRQRLYPRTVEKVQECINFLLAN